MEPGDERYGRDPDAPRGGAHDWSPGTAGAPAVYDPDVRNPDVRNPDVRDPDLPPRARVVAAPPRGRPGLIVLTAFLVQLVVIAATGNQGLTDRFVRYSQQHTSFLGNAVRTLTVYSWRYNAIPNDPDRLFASQMFSVLAYLVFSALLTLALVRGPVTFGRAFFAVFASSIAATFLAGLVGRGILRYYGQFQGIGGQATYIVFATNGTQMAASAALGIVAGLIAAFIAVVTRRPAVVPVAPVAPPEPDYRDPDAPPPYFGEDDDRPSMQKVQQSVGDRDAAGRDVPRGGDTAAFQRVPDEGPAGASAPGGSLGGPVGGSAGGPVGGAALGGAAGAYGRRHPDERYGDGDADAQTTRLPGVEQIQGHPDNPNPTGGVPARGTPAGETFGGDAQRGDAPRGEVSSGNAQRGDAAGAEATTQLPRINDPGSTSPPPGTPSSAAPEATQAQPAGAEPTRPRTPSAPEETAPGDSTQALPTTDPDQPRPDQPRIGQPEDQPTRQFPRPPDDEDLGHQPE